MTDPRAEHVSDRPSCGAGRRLDLAPLASVLSQELLPAAGDEECVSDEAQGDHANDDPQPALGYCEKYDAGQDETETKA